MKRYLLFVYNDFEESFVTLREVIQYLQNLPESKYDSYDIVDIKSGVIESGYTKESLDDLIKEMEL